MLKPKASIISLFLIVAGVIAFVMWPDQEESIAPLPPETPIAIPEPPRQKVLSDQMLTEYRSDETTGKSDLRMIGAFVDSVFLLVKNRDTREYGTNEDLAEFLQGKNAYRTRYLGADSPALNEKGQLIDRWGSPLIVHPISTKLLEIHSAGPDKKPYTEDDLKWPPR